MQGVMCQGITHDCSLGRSTLSWGLQVQQYLLWRIHGCVIPSSGRSSTKNPTQWVLLARAFRTLVLQQRRWNICEGIMLEWVGSPPRRYHEDIRPQVVVHLKPPPCSQQVSRNRFLATIVNMKYVDL